MLDQKFQKQQKHYVNTSQKFFWDDGFVNLDILENKEKKNIFNTLNSINNNSKNYKTIIKDKYKSLKIIDIREDNNFYDDFIDFLKADQLIEKLNFITCKKLIPIAIKIRINGNQKKKNLFFNRHRDTYKSNNIIYGNIPPLVNLHIYPECTDFKAEKQLRVWPGSHKRFYNNFIDKININFAKSLDIKTDNNKMLLFDTSLVHAIYPTKNPLGSIRCMFNFLDEHQIHDKIEDYSLVCEWKKKLYDI
jgi:hypothetical protein